MRLLQSKSLRFEVYLGDDVPRYAILSHRWMQDTNQEVTLQDMNDGTAQAKMGYSKIKDCAKQAIMDGIDYFWIDTCCIDKTSSAELSEAINSMYRWYKHADICYAYLSDVSINDAMDSTAPTVATLGESNWFTRGWTLQELIAPLNMTFFSKEWVQIGTKTQLLSRLEAITGIEDSVLGGKDLSAFSIAQKMSWAAKRVTTRVEDIAYSLLGIFDVNMPLLYGEGNKAFVRLQEEIIKSSNDQSIFAWESSWSNSEPYMGLLARSPADFMSSRDIWSLGFWSESEPCSVTSRGLHTRFHLSPNEKERGTYHALLECTYSGKGNMRPAILLQLVSNFEYGSQYVRVGADNLHFLDLKFIRQGVHKPVYVRQNIDQLFLPNRLVIHASLPLDTDLFWIRSMSAFHLEGAIPSDRWNSESKLFLLPPRQTGRLLITGNTGTRESTRTSLLFELVDGIPVCSLQSPQVVPGHPALRKDSGFGTSAQWILTRSTQGGTVYGTAKTGQRLYESRIVYTIVLFVKTM